MLGDDLLLVEAVGLGTDSPGGRSLELGERRPRTAEGEEASGRDRRAQDEAGSGRSGQSVGGHAGHLQ